VGLEVRPKSTQLTYIQGNNCPQFLACAHLSMDSTMPLTN